MPADQSAPDSPITRHAREPTSTAISAEARTTILPPQILHSATTIFRSSVSRSLLSAGSRSPGCARSICSLAPLRFRLPSPGSRSQGSRLRHHSRGERLLTFPELSLLELSLLERAVARTSAASNEPLPESPQRARRWAHTCRPRPRPIRYFRRNPVFPHPSHRQARGENELTKKKLMPRGAPENGAWGCTAPPKRPLPPDGKTTQKLSQKKRVERPSTRHLTASEE
ncbi:MAG: hypothetical protein RL685_1007 [Pseudomonadota bacterium]|jgi:hypothetical protein